MSNQIADNFEVPVALYIGCQVVQNIALAVVFGVDVCTGKDKLVQNLSVAFPGSGHQHGPAFLICFIDDDRAGFPIEQDFDNIDMITFNRSHKCSGACVALSWGFRTGSSA